MFKSFFLTRQEEEEEKKFSNKVKKKKKVRNQNQRRIAQGKWEKKNENLFFFIDIFFCRAPLQRFACVFFFFSLGEDFYSKKI